MYNSIRWTLTLPVSLMTQEKVGKLYDQDLFRLHGESKCKPWSWQFQEELTPPRREIAKSTVVDPS